MNIFQAAIDRTSPARRGLAAAVVVWCACCATLHGQPTTQPSEPVVQPASAPAAPTNPPAPSAWRFEIAPFLWMAGVDGSSTIGSLESSFEADFDDIVGDLDFGFMLHAEADKGPWTILFDGMALDLGAEGQGLGGGDIDSDVEMVIIDLGVAYQFLDVPLGGSNDAPANGPRLGLQVLGGARYTHLGIEVEPAILASRERNADLVDPYVGGGAKLQLTNRLILGAQGTVGGFGVGSDFAWTATGRVDYRITRAISLVAGYHVMEYEFDDRGSGENFDVDIQLHGPFLGVAFTF